MHLLHREREIRCYDAPIMHVPFGLDVFAHSRSWIVTQDAYWEDTALDGYTRLTLQIENDENTMLRGLNGY